MKNTNLISGNNVGRELYHHVSEGDRIWIKLGNDEEYSGVIQNRKRFSNGYVELTLETTDKRLPIQIENIGIDTGEDDFLSSAVVDGEDVPVAVLYTGV